MVPWFIMNSNFVVSPGCIKYAWDGSGPGFKSDYDVFFFSIGKYSYAKNVDQLFVCLCFFGLVATSKIVFFLLQKLFIAVVFNVLAI